METFLKIKKRPDGTQVVSAHVHYVSEQIPISDSPDDQQLAFERGKEELHSLFYGDIRKALNELLSQANYLSPDFYTQRQGLIMKIHSIIEMTKGQK